MRAPVLREGHRGTAGAMLCREFHVIVGPVGLYDHMASVMALMGLQGADGVDVYRFRGQLTLMKLTEQWPPGVHVWCRGRAHAVWGGVHMCFG